MQKHKNRYGLKFYGKYQCFETKFVDGRNQCFLLLTTDLHENKNKNNNRISNNINKFK